MALPIFEMIINPDETSDVEVSFIALVDKPAIEKNFMAFNSQLLYFKFDADKRIISGPAMVADVPIYRRDETGEYNVFFSASTIKEIALKFAKKGYAKNLNLFHDPNLPAEGVTVFNSFVSDKAMGIQPMQGFEDLPDGSWFISAKVENEEIWQKIKSGQLKGFSVEGNFSFIRNEQKQEKQDLIEKGLMADIKKMLTEFRDSFKSLFQNDVQAGATNTTAAAAPATNGAAPATNGTATTTLVTAKTKDGKDVSITELKEGGVMTMGDVPCPPGEYELEDGTKITVGEGGVITAVVAGQAPAPDFAKEFSAINEKFTGYEQKFAAYEQKFADYETRFTEQGKQLNAANGSIVKLLEIVEKLAETPTADPANQGGGNFSSDYAQTKQERLATLAANLNKLKLSKTA